MDYNWDDARIFLAVARAGKINAAAEQLNLTTITVSRRIAALETRFKTVLFTRLQTGVELTDIGRNYFMIFERAEREMLSASAMADEVELKLGTVRLAAPDGLTLGLIAPKISKLCQKHPSLNLELVPLSRHFSLSKREADLAVMIGKPKGNRLHSFPLAKYHLGLYASKSYLENNGTPEKEDDLAGHSLIGFVDDLIISEELNYTKDIWSGWENHISIHSAMGQIEAVRAGAGIGVLHEYLVRLDGDLVPIMPERNISRSYWLVIHENMKRIPRIQFVANFLQEIVDEV